MAFQQLSKFLENTSQWYVFSEKHYKIGYKTIIWIQYSIMFKMEKEKKKQQINDKVNAFVKIFQHN